MPVTPSATAVATDTVNVETPLSLTFSANGEREFSMIWGGTVARHDG